MLPSESRPAADSATDPTRIEPLSGLLERLFDAEGNEDRTLNELLRGLEGRGPLAVIVLLNLPFLAPGGLPGLSIIFGIVMLFLSGQLMFGRPAALPAILGNRRVRGSVLRSLVRAGVKVLRWLERGIHPRPTVWVTSVASQRFNAALVFWGALLLALPLPPTIPCSNLIPSVAIILLAMSMGEEDGSTIWWAYGSILGATAYLGVMLWWQASLLLGLLVRMGHLLGIS